MLKRLTIHQFVIIDKLSLDFQPGLTVLTGETGAGKSILMDAMGLILGNPPERESIREGSPESLIEAAFAPPAAHPLWAFLAAHELPANPVADLIIRRTFSRAGKDEILVNDRMVGLELLKEIGAYLVEIHGQFANHNLLERQLALLDAFGAYPPEVLGNVAQAWRDMRRLTRELEEERAFIGQSAHEQGPIERNLRELKNLGMRKGLYEDTVAEHVRLLNVKGANEVFQSVHSLLVASNGVDQALAKCNNIVGRQKGLDDNALEKLSEYLAAALEKTREAVDEMNRLMPKYEINTAPIAALEKALETLRRIAIERKVEPEGLYDVYEQLTTKLERIRNARYLIAKLTNDLDKTKAAYMEHAHRLTEERIKAAKKLSQAITAEMPPLRLTHGQFQADVSEKVHNEWSELGFNDVHFTARMNPGMPFSPIAATASGGELARLILALKVVLQKVQTIPTLVFDEIDTGIDGAAAAAVGERIARLAATTQVLVITHSPQVASRADHHLHVSKKTDEVTTQSTVISLPMPERIEEISRMLSGDAITPESRAAAESLIIEAKRAAESRSESRPFAR
jgi:DNA repair protein RecN (Recombination protein N)